VDATADGIPLLRVGVNVGITVVGIDTEDGEAGAAVRTTEAQQQRPRHPRGDAHLVATPASYASKANYASKAHESIEFSTGVRHGTAGEQELRMFDLFIELTGSGFGQWQAEDQPDSPLFQYRF
jgi:hypothetical protein